MSIQVKQLEGHARAELFERVGRRLKLTQAGEEVLAHAREILGHIRGAEEAIAELDSLERGLLDVAVINAGDHFFPWIVAAFREQHPGIRVRLTVQNRDELLARLARPRDRPRGDEPSARRARPRRRRPSRRTRT